MNSQVRPELPTASVGSSQAPTAAVDNSAPFSNRPQSTYKSGNAVQTSGATAVGTVHGLREQRSDEAGSMADLVVKAIEADSAGRS
jgi:hypothetical protein